MKLFSHDLPCVTLFVHVCKFVMNARRARGVGGVDETRRCAKSLAGRPARLWADRVEQMRGQKAEREIALIFDAPFPAPGAPGASGGPSGPQVSDLVEQKSAGLRLEYSASTVHNAVCMGVS